MTGVQGMLEAKEAKDSKETEDNDRGAVRRQVKGRRRGKRKMQDGKDGD
jgi:hypothetical protein